MTARELKKGQRFTYKGQECIATGKLKLIRGHMCAGFHYIGGRRSERTGNIILTEKETAYIPAGMEI